MDDDRQFRLISQGIEGMVTLVRLGFIAVILIWLGSYLRDAFVAFAGKQTDANLSFSLLTKLQADRWIAYLFGMGGVGYGLVERRLRQRNIQRLTARPAELETRLHAARSSSGLTPEGKTRKEDR